MAPREVETCIHIHLTGKTLEKLEQKQEEEEKRKDKKQGEEKSLYESIDKQLKLNRKLLKSFNKAGKAVVRKDEILKEGLNPKYFPHFWKNKKGDVYLFCYEFGFLSFADEKDNRKFTLVKWQDYMASNTKK
jgi:hypothetical protein